MDTKSLANTTLAVDKNVNMQTEDFLKKFPSVFRVIWIDRTNSSGDGWSGIIVEKTENEKYNLLEFFQEHDSDYKKSIYVENAINGIPLPEEDIDDAVADYKEYLSDLDNNLWNEVAADNSKPKVSKNTNVGSLELPFE